MAGESRESASKESIVDLVELIAKALVDKPDEVEVSSIEAGRTQTVELSVDDSDLGKVIGRKGRTAKSIRTLLGAVGAKMDRRLQLEILEP